MALVVEDGTGRADAESYASTADADTYHSNLGNVAWAALQDAQKEQLLRAATQFMVRTYRPRWKGFRMSTTQTLDWPRMGCFIDDIAAFPSTRFIGQYLYMVPVNVVPDQVKEACMELALIALTTPLITSVVNRTTSRVKTGSVDITFAPGSGQLPRFPAIYRILAPFLEAGGNVMRVHR